MLYKLLVVGYATLVGFVAAGIAASFYRMMTSEPARFRLLGQGFLATFSSVIFCALTGPIIVVDHAIDRRKADGMAFGWLVAGVGVAALWSCCVGIVVLEFALAVRESLA